MLGEDGMVFDDGVTARLGEHHYLMTTTSGGAARVLAWLEEWLQTEWPELHVFCTSVTEQWATVSLCGPECRRLVAELAPDLDLDPERFPAHERARGRGRWACRRGSSASASPASSATRSRSRRATASRSGSAASRPAQHYGITPYGTEAMHVLRAEKGYIIAGQETDGTVTPADLGMGWIVAQAEAATSSASARSRAPTSARRGRKQLVGLLPEPADELLEEGAQIVADPHQRIPMAMLGHVTSSYRSPNLGRCFALALVADGRARIGHKLYVPLLDRTIAVTVTEPLFLDPEGSRLHA